MASKGTRPKHTSSMTLRNTKDVDYKRMNEGYELFEHSGDSNQEDYALEDTPSGASPVIPEIVVTKATPQIDKTKFVSDARQSKIEKLKAEIAELKSQEEQLRLRNEEDELRRELLERRKQVANLRGKIPQPSVVSKNRTTIQTESSFSKINEDLNIDNLRKSKRLRGLVSKEMKDCGLIDSEDSCAADVSEIESIDSFLHAEADSEACSKSMHKTKSKEKETTRAKTSASVSQYSYSDTSSDSEVFYKKDGKKKIKSGIHAKSSDSVRNRQRYPQAHLRFEFAGSDLSFASLDLNLFVAGELEIISDCRTGKVERIGRLNLLKKLMYLSTSYELETLKSYYKGVLREIEMGLKTWRDDFQYVESAVLSKSVPRSKSSSLSSTQLKKSTSKFNSKKINEKSSENEEKVWFCALYQRNKCAHKSAHTLVVKGKMRYAQHICASCWQKDHKKLEHPESSSACPHSSL